MLTAPRTSDDQTRPPRVSGPARSKKGRHRAPSRWALYRSSHGDNEGNLVSLLIPAWRGTSQRPGDGRPPTVIDLTATPSLPLPVRTSPSATRHIPPVEPEPAAAPYVFAPPMPSVEIPHHTDDWTPAPVAFEVITPPIVDVPPAPLGPVLGPQRPQLGPLFGPILPLGPPPATSVVLGPIIDLRDARPAAVEAPPITPPAPAPSTPPPPADRRPVSVVVDRSVVLPVGKEERGTFANMLGFGEDEAYYGPTASLDIDEATSHYQLAATAITMPITVPEQRESEWDALPGLADVTTRDEPTDTNTLVGRLWEATADQPILGHVEVPEPIAPDRVLLGAKRWRWSVIGGLAVAVVLVFVAGSAAGRRPIEAARERAIEYTQSAQRLAAAIGPLDQTADAITDLTAAEIDMGPIIANLDSFDGVARDVAGVTATELPNPALLGSSAEIDRLERPQDLLQQAASTASTVERRLGDALTYRLTFGRAFILPELPVTLAPEDVADLGAEFSVAIASTEAILAELPDDAFFLSHHRRAEQTLETLADQHVDYLDALRQADPARAGVVRRDMVVAIAQLREELEEPMTALSTWAEDQLNGLRDLIGVIDDELR